MLRNIDLNEISDGNLYTSNDLVRADCGGCHGCSDCCQGMGDSIILDPYDMDQLYRGAGLQPEDLLLRVAELSIVDGIILPHLKMTGERGCCPFLSEAGRCQIHAFRPGFCRLFPLGRLYEDGSFSYFLQTKECKKTRRSKIRIKKWLGIPDLTRYEDYVCNWHYLLMDLQSHIERTNDEAYQKQVSMYVLQNFYLTPYPEEGFYEAFKERYETCKKLFHLS
nr:YkgJ family cysteine cluster protein [uncultured Sellimonas sp.]